MPQPTKFGVSVLFVLSMTAMAETRWIRIETPNFEMYTTAGERSAKDTLRYFEQVHSFFSQAIPSWNDRAPRVRIVAFNSEKEYEPYRPTDFAIAFYHQTVSHDYIVMSHTGAETFPTAIHEYVHLVVRHSNLKLPPWLDEGLAELYSTLQPRGKDILVGSIIPGRYRALLLDKWVPLATLLAADHNSPYYNEKNKAGSLYNEGWALTHMLVLSPQYRLKSPQVFRAISDGKPSATALEEGLGKRLWEIEKELMSYLRGGSFQGVLFPVKLEKVGNDLNAEAADEFEVKLALAEVGNGPGRRAETYKVLGELIAEKPDRPEAYIELAELDWQERRLKEARERFAKAYELGSRDPRMLWDYGRVAASAADPDQSIEPLRELLKLQPDRLEVRMELASVQLRANAAKDALETLAPVKKISAVDAPRFLTLLAYADLNSGDRERAVAAANQLKTVSSKPEDRAHADQIIQFVENLQKRPAQPRLPQDAAERSPNLPSPDQGTDLMPAAPSRPALTGTFAELRCANRAQIVLQTPQGKKVLAIDDPTQLLVNGKNGDTMDLSCGVQKPVQVRVEYDPAGADRPGVDGIARAIHFEP
ncbi:MAG TPA: hypothetical protein VKX49_28025 [Bryobacteraceae bacterium]|nr:hypothetical protein [Bryobacteraceae bacterium]